jgi:hypothetical protein
MTVFRSKFFLITLVILLLILSVNALVGGALMIIKPDGSLLGFPDDYLANTPFADYTIPGILLFSCVGVVSAIALIGMVRVHDIRWLEKLNLYKSMYWGWTFSFYAAIITLIWIGSQILMTDFFWLQPAILGMGVVMIVILLMPSVVGEHEKMR